MLLGEFRLLFEDRSTKLHKSNPSFFSETTLKFNALSNNLVLLTLCKQACFHTIQQACLTTTTTTLFVCFLCPHPHMIPLSYYICFKIEKERVEKFYHH